MPQAPQQNISRGAKCFIARQSASGVRIVGEETKSARMVQIPKASFESFWRSALDRFEVRSNVGMLTQSRFKRARCQHGALIVLRQQHEHHGSAERAPGDGS